MVLEEEFPFCVLQDGRESFIGRKVLDEREEGA